MMVERTGTLTIDDTTYVDIAFTHPGDPATDEAFLSLMDALGATAVPLDDVARLVKEGIDVWSFGYGWDDDDDGFTVLTDDDLWAWSAQDGSLDVIASWGPFYAARKDGAR